MKTISWKPQILWTTKALIELDIKFLILITYSFRILLDVVEAE